MKKHILIIITALFLTACNTGASKVTPSPSATPNPSPSPSATPDPAMLKPAEERTITENTVPDSGYVFELTDEEEELFEAFKASKDMNVFKDVDPKSIAKIHIMYGVRGEWESEYEMFYKEDGMKLSKEDYHNLYQRDLSYEIEETKQSYANWYFPFMGDGEFEIKGNEGVLRFNSVPENPEDTEEDTAVNFWMVKDANGLWWVRENPLYWGAED